MSRGVNKVILIGTLGSDPDMKGDGGIANISIATNESWKDKDSGEKKERTEWHRCVAYGKKAEIAGQYLKKGSKLYVEGRLQTRKWQGQDGKDNYTTEIIINDFQMLDSRGQTEQNSGLAPMQGQPQQQGNFQNQGGQPQQQQGNFQNQGNQPQQQGGFQNQIGQPQQQQGNFQNQDNQPQQQGNFQNQGGQPQQQGNQAPVNPQADFDDDIPF